MTTSAFCRYDLRTTDADAARSFYAELIGPRFTEAPSPEEPSPLAVWPLHEQARARGAPSHWLGQIGVADLDATLQRWVELGNERLSPTLRGQDGTAFATLRDPDGAVVAVRASTRGPRRSPIAWHQLLTRDVERSWATYAELFGWTHSGEPHTFTWDDPQLPVGGMANISSSPGMHPHWLFFFTIPDLDAALATVRARGGQVIAPTTLASGDRLAPCEDPQGAAFGLYQPRR